MTVSTLLQMLLVGKTWLFILYLCPMFPLHMVLNPNWLGYSKNKIFQCWNND